MQSTTCILSGTLTDSSAPEVKQLESSVMPQVSEQSKHRLLLTRLLTTTVYTAVGMEGARQTGFNALNKGTIHSPEE